MPRARRMLRPAVVVVTLLLPAACFRTSPATTGSGTNADGPPADAQGEGADGFQLAAQMEPFGETEEGVAVERYLLTNRNGMKVTVINYGATITSVEVPDRNGEFANVTLGFDKLRDYQERSPYFGCICGRYANRIALGKFTLDGIEYQLATNNGPHHLHGGERGFDRQVWRGTAFTRDDEAGVSLTLVSPDGEEGYPGELTTTVVYTLTNDNELKIDYTAHVTGKATVLNLTNHCYWNLGGAGSGDVLGHELMLACDHYLPVDDMFIPTGELKPVAGTPMDFTQPRAIGARIAEVMGGYDHCYVVNRQDDALVLAARLRDPRSGRVMEVRTTEPGIQLYTGNFLDGSKFSGGFNKHAGVCLECQHFPDSPNRPEFPSVVLEPQQVYRQTTVHTFSVDVVDP